MTPIEMRNVIARATQGADGQSLFDVLLSSLVGVYRNAPTECQVEMVARVLAMLKRDFNLDIKGMAPNDPQAFKRERKRIDQVLSGLPTRDN